MKKKIFYSFTILIAIYLVISFVMSPERTLMSHIFGAFFSAIFFLASMRFIDKKLVNMLNKDTHMGGEIISQGLINHLRGIIADGGVGYLLNDRFVFHPHKLNFSTKDLTFLLSEIEQVQSCKIMFFFDTGLRIRLKSGKEEKFVVNKKSEFYTKLLNFVNC
jgi:hypothetical protein